MEIIERLLLDPFVVVLLLLDRMRAKCSWRVRAESGRHPAPSSVVIIGAMSRPRLSTQGPRCGKVAGPESRDRQCIPDGIISCSYEDHYFKCLSPLLPRE